MTTHIETTHIDQTAESYAVLPFGWETADPNGLAEAETLFRFPAVDDPNPGNLRLLTMSVYASLLGLAGVGVGARGLVSSIGGGVPGWYIPVLAGAGLVSVALSVAAFLSIHRRVLPWLLMLAAALPLSGAVMLAVSY